MKNINNIVSQATKIIGLCSIAGLIGMGQSKAAQIKLEVRVPGYTQKGNGWAVVMPGSSSFLGGRIAWDSAHNCYITDRVSRGETMRITVLATSPLERCSKVTITGTSSGNFSYYASNVRLPYVINSFVVSSNPAFKNVVVSASTTAGGCNQPIPIGSRAAGSAVIDLTGTWWHIWQFPESIFPPEDVKAL